MSNQFIEPKVQFIGDDGLPIVNGSVTIYAAGTNNLVDSYANFSGTVKNTNPIILDAEGRASIWLSFLTYYKVVIKDSAGNVLRTDDNVKGSGVIPSDYAHLYDNCNVNGYSIISGGASDKDINLAPSGAGQLKITSIALQDNLTANGYKLLFSNSSGISSKATGNKLLYFTSVSAAARYLVLAGSTTTLPVGIEASPAVGLYGFSFKPKGTGTLNISGASVNNSVATYALTTRKVCTDYLEPNYSGRLSTLTFATFSFAATSLTLAASKNISSITDAGVGDATINFTSSYASANYTVVGGSLGNGAAATTYYRVTNLGTNSLKYKTYTSSTDAAADLGAGAGGTGILLLGSLS